MRRARGRVALAVVFALLALNALVQVALVPLGHSGDPPVLTVLQALVGAAGAAAAWGSWAGTRWAPWAALAYGLVTAGMLAALVPLLELNPGARGGVWLGAACVFAFALWAAWYLRRSVARAAADADRAPT
jgi:hypothetical protein